jgi:anti-anti-sigma regulatory factor/CHASE3 domain sensor protein
MATSEPAAVLHRPSLVVGRRRPALALATVARLILLAGLLVMIGTMSAMWFELLQEDRSNDQLDQARQVQMAALDLTVGMVNQETGVRGYTNTARPVFLDPYTLGQTQARNALARLEARGQDPLYRAAVTEVRARAAEWSTWAEARRAAVGAAGHPVIDVAASDAGRALFDRFRAADDRLAALAAGHVDAASTALGDSRARVRAALLVGGPLVFLCLLGLAVLLIYATLRPLSRLAAAATSLASGQATDVPGTARMDEVGSLARALTSWQAAEAAKRERDLAIRELSTPALELKPGLLVLPIIGALDSDRARQLTGQLLASIRRRRARVVVIDITGVFTVDSEVAGRLLHTVECCRLMGARTILTGFSAETAQTLTRIGVNLAGLVTAGDLRDGIESADLLLGSGRPAPERAGFPSRIGT